MTTTTNDNDNSTSTMKSEYYMPAEWHPHRATIILFPHNASTFRSVHSKCDLARQEILNIARAIACWPSTSTHASAPISSQREGREESEDVFLLCNTEEEANELKKELCSDDGTEKATDVNKGRGNIIIKVCKSDDTWARDTCPTFLIPRNDLNSVSSPSTSSYPLSIIGLDWNFNAYGGPEDGCYWPCENDKQIASSVIEVIRNHYDSLLPPCSSLSSSDACKFEHKKVDIILEGGSIHADGKGTILTTSECLLHPNRNPDKSKKDIESLLLRELGASKIIWLPKGLAFDEDTNGHVDNFACFARPGEIILAWCDEKNKDVDRENYDRCREAMAFLENMTDAEGRELKIWKLPLPPPMFYTEEDVQELQPMSDGSPPRSQGERLAASYVNFYISNNAVIVPQYGDTESDNTAIKVLEEVFPHHSIVGIFSREILIGGGNIHCVTQQLPRLYNKA